MDTLVNAWHGSKRTRVVIVVLGFVMLCCCYSLWSFSREDAAQLVSSPASTSVRTVTPESQPRVIPPTLTPSLTPTQVTPSPSPTDTPIPTVDTAACRLGASFVVDVTVPDNTAFQSGEEFTKTWRVRNTGTCPWGPGYQLSLRGGDQLGEATLAAVSETAPGEECDVTVAMMAPQDFGKYRSEWQFCVNLDQCFGVKLYVQIIVVPPPTATPRPTLPPTATPFPTSAGASKWLTYSGERVGVKQIAWNTSLGYFTPETGHIYLSLYIIAINVGDSEETFNPLDFSVVDGGGEVTGGVIFGEKHPSFDVCTVRPGGVCEGWWTTMIWNREEVRDHLTLRWSPGWFSPTKETPILQE